MVSAAAVAASAVAAAATKSCAHHAARACDKGCKGAGDLRSLWRFGGRPEERLRYVRVRLRGGGGSDKGVRACVEHFAGRFVVDWWRNIKIWRRREVRTFEKCGPSTHPSHLLLCKHRAHGRVSLHFARESLHGIQADGTLLFFDCLESKRDDTRAASSQNIYFSFSESQEISSMEEGRCGICLSSSDCEISLTMNKVFLCCFKSLASVFAKRKLQQRHEDRTFTFFAPMVGLKIWVIILLVS